MRTYLSHHRLYCLISATLLIATAMVSAPASAGDFNQRNGAPPGVSAKINRHLATFNRVAAQSYSQDNRSRSNAQQTGIVHYSSNSQAFGDPIAALAPAGSAVQNIGCNGTDTFYTPRECNVGVNGDIININISH